jgi:hypothetical protein
MQLVTQPIVLPHFTVNICILCTYLLALRGFVLLPLPELDLLKEAPFLFGFIRDALDTHVY